MKDYLWEGDPDFEGEVLPPRTWPGFYPEGKGPIRAHDDGTGRKRPRRAIKPKISPTLTGDETIVDWEHMFNTVAIWAWGQFQNDHGGEPEHQQFVDFLELTKRLMSQPSVSHKSADGSSAAKHLRALASLPIETMPIDGMDAQWLTIDDIASRYRARLIEEKYWWTP